MTEVVDLTPAASVQMDGDACEFRQELTRIALEIASVRLRMKKSRRCMSARDADRLEQAGRMLDQVLRLLTAIDEATTSLEHQAKELLACMSEGAGACFPRRDTSVGIGVDGTFFRRKQTLRVDRFFVAQPMPSIFPRGNDNQRALPRVVEAARATNKFRAALPKR